MVAGSNSLARDLSSRQTRAHAGPPAADASARQLLNRNSTLSPSRSSTSSASARCCVQVRVLVEDPLRDLARLEHVRDVARQPAELEVADPGLALAEHLARSRGSRGRARRAGTRRSTPPSPPSAPRRRASTGPRTGSTTPRPHRDRRGPRSWWSCESPNRSASSTIITVAFGTSTPTSMTVVATSTSISPARNAVIAASFSAAGIWPCSSPTRSPASSSAARRSASSVAAFASTFGDPSTSGHTTYAWCPAATSVAQPLVRRGARVRARADHHRLRPGCGPSASPAARTGRGRRRRASPRSAGSASPSSPARPARCRAPSAPRAARRRSGAARRSRRARAS